MKSNKRETRSKKQEKRQQPVKKQALETKSKAQDISSKKQESETSGEERKCKRGLDDLILKPAKKQAISDCTIDSHSNCDLDILTSGEWLNDNHIRLSQQLPHKSNFLLRPALKRHYAHLNCSGTTCHHKTGCKFFT